MRWASAVSDRHSPEQAVQECVSSTGREFVDRGPDQTVAFVSNRHADEYERAPSLVQEALSARVFMGCSAGGATFLHCYTSSFAVFRPKTRG